MAKNGWLQRALKIEPGISLGQWIWDRIANNGQTIITLLGGGLMTYLAAVTDWLEPWGPVGYGAVGLVSAVFIAASISSIYAVFSWGKQRSANARATDRYYEAGDRINPLETAFVAKRINLSDLLPPLGDTISAKTFRNCELVGPLNIFPNGCTISNCGYVNCDHVVITARPMENGYLAHRVHNGYVFEHCQFIDCKFFFVSFLVPAMGVEDFTKGGGCNWITDLPQVEG
ncbi:hypothetical protein [Parvibaculum sp.]|uniref:hypothetical protein n=1 Tax=Parvibaculum sp. TaxID=2024848 RepID=UPI003298B459